MTAALEEPERLPALLGPETVEIGGHRMAKVLLLVHSKREGRPKLCSLLRGEDPIDFEGGEEFCVAYVPAEALRGK